MANPHNNINIFDLKILFYYHLFLLSTHQLLFFPSGGCLLSHFQCSRKRGKHRFGLFFFFFSIFSQTSVATSQLPVSVGLSEPLCLRYLSVVAMSFPPVPLWGFRKDFFLFDVFPLSLHNEHRFLLNHLLGERTKSLMGPPILETESTHSSGECVKRHYKYKVFSSETLP